MRWFAMWWICAQWRHSGEGADKGVPRFQLVFARAVTQKAPPRKEHVKMRVLTVLRLLTIEHHLA
jgi:hypothetical protein